MNQKQADEIRQNVRNSYSEVAQASDNGDCCGEQSSCCGVSSDEAINTLVSTRLGYSETDLISVPQGADMGLGCGNPRAIASIRPGETVLDLGSGGGFDCFLAAAETGDHGHADDGIDDPESDSDACRGLGRLECRHGRYGCGHAVGRDGCRQASGKSRGCHGPNAKSLRLQPPEGHDPVFQPASR